MLNLAGAGGAIHLSATHHGCDPGAAFIPPKAKLGNQWANALEKPSASGSIANAFPESPIAGQVAKRFRLVNRSVAFGLDNSVFVLLFTWVWLKM